MTVVVNRLTPADTPATLRDVAAIHIASIHGALPLLGTAFMAELYRQLAVVPGSGVWVARQDGRVVGFLAGCCDTGAVFKSVLLRGGHRLALKAALRLTRLSLLRKIAALLLYPLRSRSRTAGPAAAAPTEPAPKAELLAIAIDASTRGLGVGKQLVAAFEAELLRPSGVTTYIVTTDAGDVGANAFYRSAGFQPTRTFPHHDMLLQCYAKQLR